MKKKLKFLEKRVEHIERRLDKKKETSVDLSGLLVLVIIIIVIVRCCVC